ncbi:uncharacterized protein LOC127241254 [Andrographis paniculata]|uniref:uncharacterized protein LOC127241254 n=1 Tax=Andrographis paniculata TaxID=175694 RepID=UPI0021E81C50|nr:uncharacterized protein LOC127241254 [Andrographis paniculata]
MCCGLRRENYHSFTRYNSPNLSSPSSRFLTSSPVNRFLEVFRRASIDRCLPSPTSFLQSSEHHVVTTNGAAKMKDGQQDGPSSSSMKLQTAVLGAEMIEVEKA